MLDAGIHRRSDRWDDEATPRRDGFGGPGRTARVRSGGAGSKTVLVVDDEASIVEMLASLLLDKGLDVVCAYDGEQAWGLVQRSPPDLVITDVSMPYLGGLDLLRRMRANSPCRQTPVIVMSAAFRRTDLHGAIYVPKPFDLARMLTVVERELAIA